MIHRSSLRRITCGSLLLQAVAALCFHGLTICIGADGHAAVAWMAADDCCPQAESTEVTAGDCDCTDGPLLQPMADKRPAGDDLSAASAAPAPRPYVSPPSHRPVPLAEYGLPPPGNLAARRSVVLQA